MTFFIKIENGQPTGNPVVKGNMEYLFPNFDFNRSLTSQMLAELGYGIYEFTVQPVVGKYKKIIEGAPEQNAENGIYYQTWQVVDMSDEEKAVQNTERAGQVRRERDSRLYRTDWILLSDAPVSETKKQEYIVYRQALRDVPGQAGFPWDVVWPNNP